MAYLDNPSITDRVLCAAIAILFAWPVGLGVGVLASFAGAESDFLFWVTLIGFAAFGFVAPRQSRNVLTSVWHGIIRVTNDLRLWW